MRKLYKITCTLFWLGWAVAAQAQIQITPANLSNACTPSGDLTLGNIVITEQQVENIRNSAGVVTYVLTFDQAGRFEFVPFASTSSKVSHSGGGTVTSLSVAATATALTLSYQMANTATGVADKITLSGIQVRAVGNTDGTVKIVRASGASGGTADINYPNTPAAEELARTHSTLTSIAPPTPVLLAGNGRLNGAGSYEICQGESAVLVVSPIQSADQYRYTYQVSTNGGTSYTDLSANSNANRFEAPMTTVAAKFRIKLTLTGTPACERFSNTVDFTRIITPTTPVIGAIADACLNEVLGSASVSVTSANTVLWFRNADLTQAITVSNPVRKSELFTTNQVGTQTVYAVAENSSGCRSAVVPVSLTVKPKPTVFLTSLVSGSFCQGQSITFTAFGADSYQYVVNDTVVNTTFTTAPLTRVFTQNAIKVQVRGNLNGCLSDLSPTISLTRNTLPNITLADTLNIRANDPDTLLVAFPVGGIFSGTGVYQKSNGQYFFSPQLAGQGTHIVRYTVSSQTSNACTTFKEMQVNVLPDRPAFTTSSEILPLAFNNPPDININVFYEDDTTKRRLGWALQAFRLEDNIANIYLIRRTYSLLKISGAGVSGALNPDYSTEFVLLKDSLASGFVFQPSVAALEPGSLVSIQADYQIITEYISLFTNTVFFTFSEIRSSFPEFINVVPPPNVTVSGLEPEYCLNEPGVGFRIFPATSPDGTGLVTIFRKGQNTPLTGNVLYFGNNQVQPNGNATSSGVNAFEFRPPTNGEYVIRYIFNKSDGSRSDTVSTETRILPIATANFDLGGPTRFCEGETIALRNLSDITATNAAFFWRFDESRVSTASNPTIAYGTWGTKTIQLIATTPDSCQTIFQRSFYVGENPQPAFTVSNRTLNGQPTVFTNQTPDLQNTNDRLRWLWNFGDNNTSPQRSPQHAYAAPGTYQVTLEVQSDSGCVARLSRPVTVFPLITLAAGTNFSEDFENGSAGWAESGAITGGARDSSSWMLGVPDGQVITGVNQNGWFTRLSDTVRYRNLERSWVESPSFVLSALTSPFLTMDIAYDLERGGDGVVVEYSTDDGATWQLLGNIGTGLNWYNVSGVLGRPGNQDPTRSAVVAWSGAGQTWLNARFILDEVKQRAGSGFARFRVALGTNTDNVQAGLEGFGFDNLFIGERNRVILAEHFVNLPNGNTNTNLLDQADAGNNGLLKIQYHTNFPNRQEATYLENRADPSARVLHYGIDAAPATLLDGRAIAGEPFGTGGWFTRELEQRSLESAPFRLAATYQLNDNLLEINTVATNLGTPISGPFLLHAVILESNLAVGAVNLQRVVRKLVPDAAGTRLAADWTANEVRNQTVAWDPVNTGLFKADNGGNITNRANFELAIFLQHEQTREVFQSVVVPIAADSIVALAAANQRRAKVGEAAAEKLLTVYPNPTQAELYVLPQGYAQAPIEWEVQDVTGRVLLKGESDPSAEGFAVPTYSLSLGIYLLRTYQQGTWQVTKFRVNKM